MDEHDSDDRRLLATVAALGPRAPDSTLRPAPGAAFDDALRSLPPVSLGDEARGDARGERLTPHEELGEGGMGRVLAATQHSLQRAVAVKVLRDADPARRAALLHEARITGRLEHPNIVPVHALGVDAQGDPVMVMKRIEGASLRALLQDASHPGWSPLDARHEDRVSAQVSVLLQVCDALSYAHAQGVVHRDVKPENVMVGPFGEVYLLDWGVALDLTAPQGDHAIVGTPAYMAPEMVDGDPARVSPRTDVFLLGATLHEVLTDAPRNAGDGLATALRAARRVAPVTYPHAVPADLAALCNDATARDPDARPASPEVFAARLREHLRHRDSRALSDDAAATLRDAQEAGAAWPRAQWERAVMRGRAGFSEALARWPENPDAADGLRRTYDALVRRALDDDLPALARARYRAWPDADPALGARIEASEANAAARRALAQQADALSRDLDPAAVKRGYAVTMAALTAIAAVITGAVLVLGGPTGRPPPLRALLVIDCAVIAFAGALLAATRRRVLANRLGARLAIVVMSSLTGLLLADGVSVALGADIYAATPLRYLLLAVGFATVSTQGLRAFWITAALCVATALASAAWPSAMNAVVAAGTALVAASVAAMVVTGRLRADALSAARLASGGDPSAPGTTARA
ncbi:MAG: serine/threonine-protein kinase [Polyangiales bacterium]